MDQPDTAVLTGGPPNTIWNEDPLEAGRTNANSNVRDHASPRLNSNASKVNGDRTTHEITFAVANYATVARHR